MTIWEPIKNPNLVLEAAVPLANNVATVNDFSASCLGSDPGDKLRSPQVLTQTDHLVRHLSQELPVLTDQTPQRRFAQSNAVGDLV